MPNVKSIINAHNKKVLANSATTDQVNTTNCNCQKRNPCPVNGECLTKGVIYQADVHAGTEIKTYVGSTGRRFKVRYYEHSQDINHDKKTQRTELAKFIWTLKKKNEKYTINWKLIRKLKNHRNVIPKICSLCNWEKIEIARVDKNRLLNKRSELTGKCMHFTKLYFRALPSYKPPRISVPPDKG